MKYLDYQQPTAKMYSNVSKGISGIITIPPGFYVGSTLAEALEFKINQIMDPVTGETVGGVSARFNASTNNFLNLLRNSGDTSTIKVKGSARLGLMMFLVELFLRYST